MSGLILQPWAFWTSLMYLPAIFGVLKRNPNVPKPWIAAALTVTAASLIAHASFDSYSLAFDEASVVIVLFSYHLKDSGWAAAWAKNFFLLLILSSIFILMPFHWWVPFVAIMFAVSAKIAVRRRGTRIFRSKEFILAMTIYGVSFLLFNFDKHPLLCQTGWYGHPTWHIGSAITTFLFADWWFREEKEKAPANRRP